MLVWAVFLRVTPLALPETPASVRGDAVEGKAVWILTPLVTPHLGDMLSCVCACELHFFFPSIVRIHSCCCCFILSDKVGFSEWG